LHEFLHELPSANSAMRILLCWLPASSNPAFHPPPSTRRAVPAGFTRSSTTHFTRVTLSGIL
jgi:hypothetical protein